MRQPSSKLFFKDTADTSIVPVLQLRGPGTIAGIGNGLQRGTASGKDDV